MAKNIVIVLHKQIFILDQVNMRLNWIMKDEK